MALLFYAPCRAVFSSRKIMEACEERLTFRVIVGDDIPNWRTISDFRKLHLKELEGLFVQILHKQYNFTDPESKIMKVSNKGWDQCVNA
jgi:transposase